MRTELFGVLPRFEWGGRWRFRGDRDRDGEEDEDGDGVREMRGDGDIGRNRRRIVIHNAPCVIRRHIPTFGAL